MNPRALSLQRRLEAPLLLAALLTIPALVIEESGAGATLNTVAVALSWVVWLAFVAEAVLLLRVVDSKGAWLPSHPLEVVVRRLLSTEGVRDAAVFALLTVMAGDTVP